MEKRLEHSEMISCLSVLDFRSVPSPMLTFHGDTEVSQLAGHFGLPEEETLNEWQLMKTTHKEFLSQCNPRFLCQTL